MDHRRRTLNHHDKLALIQEHERLKNLNEKEKEETTHPDDDILEMNLTTILTKMAVTLTGTLNDLLNPDFDWTVQGAIRILTKDDRLVYLGMILVMMSIIKKMI